MKETAEAYLGHGVTQAVVTVPAYFNDAQRRRRRTRGRLPVSTSCASSTSPPPPRCRTASTRRRASSPCTILGGGTFDVSILEISGGVFEVKATNGDTFLGGEDFDTVVGCISSDTFKKEQGIDLKQDKLAVQRLAKRGKGED